MLQKTDNNIMSTTTKATTKASTTAKKATAKKENVSRETSPKTITKATAKKTNVSRETFDLNTIKLNEVTLDMLKTEADFEILHSRTIKKLMENNNGVLLNSHLMMVFNAFGIKYNAKINDVNKSSGKPATQVYNSFKHKIDDTTSGTDNILINKKAVTFLMTPPTINIFKKHLETSILRAHYDEAMVDCLKDGGHREKKITSNSIYSLYEIILLMKQSYKEELAMIEL